MRFRKKARRVFASMKDFCNRFGTTPEQIVATWKTVKCDLRLRDEFVEELEQNVRAKT